jgi:N-acyl homoserine lactone hydrolase
MRLYLLQLGLLQPLRVPVPGYLIQSEDGTNILVDTGYPRSFIDHLPGPTSGHVPGHQSVLVRLPQTGPVLLAIDAVPVRFQIKCD